MIDVDINDRSLPKPCQTPGCTYDRYHACIFGKPDLFPQLLNQRRKGRGAVWYNSISIAQKERWANYRAGNVARDEQIVELYKNGLSFSKLSEKFQIGKSTVIGVIHRAAEAGLVEIRPRGGNFRWQIGA